MSRKLVIFDFDGTLCNTFESYRKFLKVFSDARGLPHDADKMYKGYINPSKYDMGWGIPLEQQQEMFDACTFEYEQEMIQHERYMPILFDHALDILDQLKPFYDLSIITARDRVSLNVILEHHDMSHYFQDSRTSCCANERGYKIKPEPDAVTCLISDSGHALEDIIIIGDTTSDIQMAGNAGAKSIAVLWGAHDRDRLSTASPTAFADRMMDIPPLIKQLFDQ
jgi:phosphoglycolate phosphatase